MDSTARIELDANLQTIADLREENKQLTRSFLEHARISPATKIQLLNQRKESLKSRREAAIAKNEDLKAQLEQAQQDYLLLAEERLRAHSCLQSLFQTMKAMDCQCLVEPREEQEDGRPKRLLDVVCDLQLEVHRLARQEMDQLEAQELDSTISFIRETPHPKLVDSEHRINDWKDQNQTLQKYLATAEASNQTIAGPTHNKAATNSHDTIQDKLHLTVKYDELAGQVELQNQQLQEDLASRQYYRQHEDTMKDRFERAIEQVVSMMTTKGDTKEKKMCLCQSDLEEEILKRYSTYMHK